MEEEPPVREISVPEAQQVLQEFQCLVDEVGGEGQVQLVGEIVEKEQCQKLLGDFARELFPKLHEVCNNATGAPPAPVKDLDPSDYTQLIFFVCRASVLRVQRRRLRKLLYDLRQGKKNAPTALVAVIVYPSSPKEAKESQQLMQSLLRTIFLEKPLAPAPNLGRNMELDSVKVEVEVFIPGKKHGTLHIMKAACRANRALQSKQSSPCLSRTPTGSRTSSQWETRSSSMQSLGRPLPETPMLSPVAEQPSASESSTSGECQLGAGGGAGECRLLRVGRDRGGTRNQIGRRPAPGDPATDDIGTISH
ncbi:uncharacterized protein C2orf72 homolog [Tachyglossus aculeatus]|uniref:uncharacterized protein C2orf72 homolog n=1 Tax=Tachyglossus aculeatus TaxID=9261 RepID=UPI0018F39710|nr:uncharacterized protein C2orf72 homolog [Tachyglossus aculeatus]